MLAITHGKIAGLEPRWAPYAGFSALFDNSDGVSAFYAGLASALDGLDRDLLRRTHLLCSLPPSSYHVTAWDGVNNGNLASLRPAVVELGLRPRREWSPHVTLGYFANEERGTLAEACVDDWTRRFRERLGGCRLTLSSVGLYGFADMASYFRLGCAS